MLKFIYEPESEWKLISKGRFISINQHLFLPCDMKQFQNLTSDMGILCIL